MATTPAEHLREVAAVTARDRHLITQWRGQGEAMNETGDKIAALTDVARALEGAGVRVRLSPRTGEIEILELLVF